MSEEEIKKKKLLAEKKKRALMKKKKLNLAKKRIQLKKKQALEFKTGKKRFEVKQWNSITLWTYENITTDICSICKESLCAPCVECHANGIDPFENKDDEKIKKMCTVAFGKCRHAFHWHCIEKWLSMASVHAAKCPVCGSNWEFKSYDYLFN